MKNVLIYFLYLFLIILQESHSQPFFNYRVNPYKNKINSFPMTENQKNIDINYYKLELDIDTTTNKSQVRAEIKLTVVRNPITFVDLDFVTTRPFDGMRLNTVQKVKVNDVNASFRHYDSTLNIKLSREYDVGEKITINVTYTNNADQYYFNIIYAIDIKLILTLNEPFGARFWFPCKDYNEDKADSTDMIITLPSGYFAASNGKLMNIVQDNNRKTFYWHESYPIAPYLMSISAYPYKIIKQYYTSQKDSIELFYYYMPRSEETVKRSLNFIPDVMRVFTGLFGPYPFSREKYAEAEMQFAPGGMENQTCTSIQGWNDWVRAHELAHSWWGNKITCESFHHVWFQEGAATYFATLYFKLIGDKANYDYWMNWAKYTGQGIIYRDDLSDDFNVFHGNLVYQKASWVYHMLRYIGGDTLFFKTMRGLLEDPRFSYNVINTDQFREYFENAYKMDLKWFFHQWIYEEYCPNYSCNWIKTEQSGKTNIKLNISQDKNGYIFKMPLDITIKTFNGDTTIRIWDSLQVQEFNFTVSGKVDSLFLDKDDNVLKKSSHLVNVFSDEIPEKYSLSQNYPNPFNNSTAISFSLKESGKTSLVVYDLLGRKVKTLKDELLPAGKYQVAFSSASLSSGIYFYSLQSEGFRSVKKLILLK